MRNFTNHFIDINMSLSSSIANSKAILGALIIVLSFSLPNQDAQNVHLDNLASYSSTEISCEDISKDYSKYFIHEVIDGKYGLIKNVQNGVEIILRPDRIEILKSANELTGTHEMSTYLLFNNINKVQPRGQNLVESSKQKVTDLYNNETAKFLKSEYLNVYKYTSVMYSNIYDGADLEVTLNDLGEVVFNFLPKNGAVDIPLDLKVWDSNAKSTQNGIISNGVKVTSESADISFNKEKITFKTRSRNQSGYSFKLNINSSL